MGARLPPPQWKPFFSCIVSCSSHISMSASKWICLGTREKQLIWGQKGNSSVYQYAYEWRSHTCTTWPWKLGAKCRQWRQSWCRLIFIKQRLSLTHSRCKAEADDTKPRIKNTTQGLQDKNVKNQQGNLSREEQETGQTGKDSAWQRQVNGPQVETLTAETRTCEARHDRRGKQNKRNFLHLWVFCTSDKGNKVRWYMKGKNILCWRRRSWSSRPVT